MNTARLRGDFKIKTEKIPQTFSLGWGVEVKVKNKTKQKPKKPQSQTMCPLEVWKDRAWALPSQTGLNGSSP